MTYYFLLELYVSFLTNSYLKLCYEILNIKIKVFAKLDKFNNR